MDLIQEESGKNRLSAHEEVLDSAMTARHYANRARALLKPRRVTATLPGITRVWVQREPVGVVGIIAPWNYPLTMAGSDAFAALMAGNAVVLKPASHTPRTALLLAELLGEAGLPEDVFSVLPGRGDEVGAVIVEHCDYLMFTGSTATGRELAAQAGRRLIGFSAELGGKNAMIVADDADIAKAARGALNACFSNAGQLCISIERIYVHESVAEEFTAEFVRHVNAMTVGPGRGWEVDMGSLISEEHAQRVSELVDDAVREGATVLTGATSLGGRFYAPTVLADVPPQARLYREEVFGPVVYVETVASNDDAVRRANDTDYGLNASVWAAPATGRALASLLHAGTVNINEGYAAAWISLHAPMGGWKQSGVGRRHGDQGLLKFTEARTVAEQRFMPVAGPSQLSRARYAEVLAKALRLGKGLLP
ncbi:NAD-dependent aldehyde dehydrogenase [Corynebacterium uterequi]|uniref:Aldehyde dehydrogenase n=2 Tax=Corynebacterium uterequi TaxID=1072256 RepID=A0A0G3H9N6_9CORY|nr:NAD-dependent aldehyde dehydrogenase [Corynebacterium uterequi]